jgi:acyl carrier protein
MNKIFRSDIFDLVKNCIIEHQETYEYKLSLDEGEDTRLFGGNSPIDSLGLVSLVVSIEEAIEEKWGVTIILADEKAMSRRSSPFMKVGYLIDYIHEILTAEN